MHLWSMIFTTKLFIVIRKDNGYGSCFFSSLVFTTGASYTSAESDWGGRIFSTIHLFLRPTEPLYLEVMFPRNKHQNVINKLLAKSKPLRSTLSTNLSSC